MSYNYMQETARDRNNINTQTSSSGAMQSECELLGADLHDPDAGVPTGWNDRKRMLSRIYSRDDGGEMNGKRWNVPGGGGGV